MIIDAGTVPAGSRLTADLVVVGAGPGGIVTALEAARGGLDVILLESAGVKPDPEHQQLSAAASRDPDVHAPVELAVSRQIGGTSAIWGGRCVPYDPIDFRPRSVAEGSVWPIGHSALEPYLQRACDWLKCGRAVFDVRRLTHLPPHLASALVDGNGVQTWQLERWSLPTNFGRVYRAELQSTPRLRLIAGATCTRIVVHDSGDRASRVECRTLDGSWFSVSAADFVVAAGGLESTRLLFNSPGRDGLPLGDHSGHLGHWYMAHLEGVIADLQFDSAPTETIYDYERDVDGVYVRRRFTFTEELQIEQGLPNIAGWIANPELSDARHRDPRLSFTYLSLISPLGWLFAPEAQRLSLTGTRIPGTPYGTALRSDVKAHLANVVRHPFQTLRFMTDFGVKRVLSTGRKPPGFFVYQPDNRYPFQYHAEHLPAYDSAVSLSDERDAVGMRRLNIDLRFSDADIDGVLHAHERWDEHLRRTGVGRLILRSGDPAAAVRARAGGGFHQVGTTRMSADAADGVVDENLAVHGVPNVHVVSSSSFVTSGQANSTFVIVALAVRLADRLCGRRLALRGVA